MLCLVCAGEITVRSPHDIRVLYHGPRFESRIHELVESDVGIKVADIAKFGKGCYGTSDIHHCIEMYAANCTEAVSVPRKFFMCFANVGAICKGTPFCWHRHLLTQVDDVDKPSYFTVPSSDRILLGYLVTVKRDLEMERLLGDK